MTRKLKEHFTHKHKEGICVGTCNVIIDLCKNEISNNRSRRNYRHFEYFQLQKTLVRGLFVTQEDFPSWLEIKARVCAFYLAVNTLLLNYTLSPRGSLPRKIRLAVRLKRDSL